MGLDFGQIFGDAEKAVSQGMSDLEKTGGNAALGYIEQQAVGVISDDQKKRTEAAQAGVADILNRPTAANSFGAYLTSVVSSPALKAYGGPLAVGGAIIVIGYLLLKGR